MSIAADPAGQSTYFMGQSQLLREELKEWEKSFAATHEGRKASREDIRRDPDIAQKYKLYSKIRAGPSSSPLPTKRPLPSSDAQTPRKRRRHTSSVHPSTLDPYDPPLSAQRTPAAHRISIGPTPQRDGRVLGLFDLLSPVSPAPTPSKRGRGSLLPTHANTLATPSKRRFDTTHDHPASTQSSQRLKSSSLGILKDASLTTPSARRTTTTPNRTPASTRGGVSNLRFDDTPDFLRRDSQRAYTLWKRNYENEGVALTDEEGIPISWSPMLKVRVPNKPARNGLSALVRGLRAMENERLDEEMELLREIEGGSDPTGRGAATGAPSGKRPELKPDDVLVQDSQPPDMPLGPDEHHESQNEDDRLQGTGRDGKPLRVWKKRGQKRSTRMVIMKPSLAKWKPEPKWEGGEGSEGEQVVVPETQVPVKATKVPEGQEDLSLHERDFGDQTHSKSDDELSVRGTKKRKKMKEKEIDIAAKMGKATAESKNGEGPPTKKKKKKVAPTANANFRALKIRGKGSKGRGARFGRRR